MKTYKLLLAVSTLAVLMAANGKAMQTNALGGGFSPTELAKEVPSIINLTLYDVYEDTDSGNVVRDVYSYCVYEHDEHSNLINLKQYDCVDDGSGNIVKTICDETIYTYNSNGCLIKEEMIVYDGDFEHFQNKYIDEYNSDGLHTCQYSYNWDNNAFVLESFYLYSYEYDSQIHRPTKTTGKVPYDINDFDINNEGDFSVTSCIKYQYDNDNQTNNYNVEEFYDPSGNCQGKNTYSYNEDGKVTKSAEYVYMDEFIFMVGVETTYNENGDIQKISRYRNEPTSLEAEEIYEYNELGYLTSYCYMVPESCKDFEIFVLDEHGRIIGAKQAYYEWQDDHYESVYAYDLTHFEVEHTPIVEPNNESNNNNGEVNNEDKIPVGVILAIVFGSLLLLAIIALLIIWKIRKDAAKSDKKE